MLETLYACIVPWINLSLLWGIHEAKGKLMVISHNQVL
jgi:hypothetical protein